MDDADNLDLRTLQAVKDQIGADDQSACVICYVGPTRSDLGKIGRLADGRADPLQKPVR